MMNLVALKARAISVLPGNALQYAMQQSIPLPYRPNPQQYANTTTPYDVINDLLCAVEELEQHQTRDSALIRAQQLRIESLLLQQAEPDPVLSDLRVREAMTAVQQGGLEARAELGAAIALSILGQPPDPRDVNNG